VLASDTRNGHRSGASVRAGLGIGAGPSRLRAGRHGHRRRALQCLGEEARVPERPSRRVCPGLGRDEPSRVHHLPDGLPARQHGHGPARRHPIRVHCRSDALPVVEEFPEDDEEVLEEALKRRSSRIRTRSAASSEHRLSPRDGGRGRDFSSGEDE